jgi:hypothetical protein
MRPSIDLGARCFYDRRPLRHFVTNEFREVFWTAAGGVDTRSGQTLFHVGHREYAVQYGWKISTPFSQTGLIAPNRRVVNYASVGEIGQTRCQQQ